MLQITKVYHLNHLRLLQTPVPKVCNLSNFWLHKKPQYQSLTKSTIPAISNYLKTSEPKFAKVYCSCYLWLLKIISAKICQSPHSKSSPLSEQYQCRYLPKSTIWLISVYWKASVKKFAKAYHMNHLCILQPPVL